MRFTLPTVLRGRVDRLPVAVQEETMDKTAEERFDEQCAEKRRTMDRTPRPTLEELGAMKMSEHLPILACQEKFIMGGIDQGPRMMPVGDIFRVPGGWLYVFRCDGGTGVHSVFVAETAR